MIEFIFIILIIIIAGVTPSRNKYTFWHFIEQDMLGESDDFSPEYNPLKDVRDEYNERLRIYYTKYKPRKYLLSNNCEVSLASDKNGELYFYCKERSNGKKQGRYFEVKGNKEHVSTMWAVIDMEFIGFSTYDSVRDVYYRLNHEFGTTGGLKYFHETYKKKLPAPEINKSAQNEFCKMKITQDVNGEFSLECSEIWGEITYNKVRKFILKGNKLLLYGVLADFSKNENKTKDYSFLLAKYSKIKNCELTEFVEKISTEPETIIPQDAVKEESVKYIHVESEKPLEAVDKELEQEKEKTVLPKFDERNLDL